MALGNKARKGFFPKSPTPRLNRHLLKTSTVFHAGDLVKLETDVLDVLAAADTGLIYGAISHDITTGTGVEYGMIWDDPDEEFLCSGDGDISAVVPGQTIDMIGLTGAMQVDADAVAVDLLTVVTLNVNPYDTLTSAGADMLVRITRSKHGLL